MLKKLLNLKPSLLDQIKESKIIRQKPRPIRCEKHQRPRVLAALEHLLHSRHQLPVLGVIEEQIGQDEDIEPLLAFRKASDQLIRLRAPEESISLDVSWLRQQRAVVDVVLQVLHEFGVRIVGDDDVSGPVDRADETGQAGAGAELEHRFVADERASVGLEVRRERAPGVPEEVALRWGEREQVRWESIIGAP